MKNQIKYVWLVFYPNFFRWIDRAFHELVQDSFGGHAKLCRELGARGLGLMNAEMAFRAPAVEGDLLQIEIVAITWSQKSYAVQYEARVGSRLILEATETRGVFQDSGRQMVAAEVSPLRERFGAIGYG